MTGSFVWIAISVGVFILYYFRPPRDPAISLNKVESRRPIIKFRVLPIMKVADKETQTESVTPSPMSVSSISLDFPFDFDEDYLNGSNTFHNNSPCERNLTNGSTE